MRGTWATPWNVDLALTWRHIDSVDYIGKVKAPLLVTHGQTDQVIPLRYGQALFAAANEPKHFVTMPGAGHNSSLPEEFFTSLKEFLTKNPGE